MVNNWTVSSTVEQTSHKRLVEGSNPSRSTWGVAPPQPPHTTSSPSGKAIDCKSFTEGSNPSEVSVREQMLEILDLKIQTINRLLESRKLSAERQQFLYKTRRKAQNLYNWILGGGEPSPIEVKKWLR